HWSVCFILFFFFSSRRRHTRFSRDWSSDVCSSDLNGSIISMPPLPEISSSAVAARTKLYFIPSRSYKWLNAAMRDTRHPPASLRSEERRVGKECRSLRWPYNETSKSKVMNEEE